ncbi:hypothetical protein [Halalkalicoccus ordinarius]|uniref:hypothetical protein n=1 Tax=Halalkalicoccus ordinarius TaxID=3116651 RepID=UPI00300E7596
MERVPCDEVVRAWLARERDDLEDSIEALSPEAALDALLSENPGAAAFLWRDAPVTCYRLSLSREEFDRLHVVPGPEGMLWRALSPDGTVRGAAARIDHGDPERLTRETGVDVLAIESLATSISSSSVEEPLVLSTRRGAVPWRVADGNHRATAMALSVRRGGEYVPWPAYLCVGANPVLEPLSQRVRGLFGRLRRDSKTQ